MGCGASRDDVMHEVTIEDHTREGKMGITDDEVTEERRRKRMRAKQKPWSRGGYPNQTDEDRSYSNCDSRDAITPFTSEPDSSDDTDSGTIVGDSDADTVDGMDEGQLREKARKRAQNQRNAVDILNEKNIKAAEKKNSNLQSIEKMEGVNASFMRRNNSVKASWSFQNDPHRQQQQQHAAPASQGSQGWDSDGDSDDEASLPASDYTAIKPNPWDARHVLKATSSEKSVVSQSAIGVGLKPGGGRKNKVSAEDLARSMYAAGAFLQWETTRDAAGALDRVCDVTFLDEHLLLVSQNCKSKVGIQCYNTNEKGAPGPVLGGAWIKATHGVCANPMEGNAIAATDPDSRTVQFFSTVGDGIGRWKKDLFEMPGSIAVNSDGHYIVSDIKGREKAINILNQDGKVIRRFGIGFFEWPWYVAVDSHDRVIVTEQSSSSVVIFDKNGKVVHNFARHGKGEGKLNFPNGVAVDMMDNILVADTNNFRISLFTPDGVFIKNILSHLTYKPVSMAFNDSGNLAVVSESSLHFYQTYQQKAFLL